MAIKFRRRPGGGFTWDSQEPRRVDYYVLQGENDDTLAHALVIGLVAPKVVTPAGILFRQEIEIERQGHKLHHVTVPYARKNKESLEITFSGSTTGGTANRTGGTLIARFSKDGYDMGQPNPDAPGANSGIVGHDGLIGVHQRGGRFEVDGVDVVIPVLNLQVDITYPAGIVTQPWYVTMQAITGCVNNATFLGFKPYEVLYMGCNFRDGTYAPMEVSHQFAVSRSIVNETIAGIPNCSKAGWDVGWIAYEEEGDDGFAKCKALGFYVNRVYKAVSLRAFLGFG